MRCWLALISESISSNGLGGNVVVELTGKGNLVADLCLGIVHTRHLVRTATPPGQ